MKTKKTPPKKSKKETRQETFKVSGESLLKTVKDLIAKGNVRHITIKDKSGKIVVEFPLTVGVVATAFLPIFAAIGAMAALIGECTIAVDVED